VSISNTKTKNFNKNKKNTNFHKKSQKTPIFCCLNIMAFWTILEIFDKKIKKITKILKISQKTPQKMP
jgi:hypothetical protein